MTMKLGQIIVGNSNQKPAGSKEIGQIFLMKDGTIIFGVDKDFCIGENIRFAEALEKYAKLVKGNLMRHLQE